MNRNREGKAPKQTNKPTMTMQKMMKISKLTIALAFISGEDECKSIASMLCTYNLKRE
jgi:hypothetical protein